ncbi:MAG: hypothetical protein ACHQYP_11585 [Nitrospiria bacterium]
MRTKLEQSKIRKKLLLILVIGFTGWMVSSCVPYGYHTSLMMDYPYTSYESNYDQYGDYGPYYSSPGYYYAAPYYYGDYYGGYGYGGFGNVYGGYGGGYGGHGGGRSIR